MSAQFDQRSTSYDQFAAAAAKANRLALENAESMFGLQLKAFGQNINATTDFLEQVAGARDLGSYQTLLPKGLQLARDNLERLASASQDAMGMSLRTSGEIGEMAKHQFESVSEQVQASMAKAGKARRRG